MQKIIFFILFIGLAFSGQAQIGNASDWSKDGNGYYTEKSNQIIHVDIKSLAETLFVSEENLTPAGQETPLKIKSFKIADDFKKVLIFTNSKKVWRYETRGDYWLLDLESNKLHQIGKERQEATLMFAKISPDGKKVAYVSEHNVYTEDIKSGNVKLLTSTNGTKKLINGTFDWAYEEEFSCLDGFRWSPDSKSIAYWQIDANKIRDFYMINNTDSIYSFTVPVEYPKVGESPSACKIGVVDIRSGKTKWMQVEGDERQNYIPRMEWANSSKKLILQQLNRKQNTSKLIYADSKTGKANVFYQEKDDAWISIRSAWKDGNGWYWLDGGKSFLWVTEQDGWRHIYKISKDGKKVNLVTKGEFDIIDPLVVDEDSKIVYYTASPENATEKYLYMTKLNGNGAGLRVTPLSQEGTHSYQITPNGKYANHSFSNYYTSPKRETISLPNHKSLDTEGGISHAFDQSEKSESNVKFFQVETEDGITMDGYMALPKNFDAEKKYPVLFTVYGEPAGQTVINRWGTGRNGLYVGDMAEDGYIYMSVEGRGAPAPKGRAWRKSIYRKIGIINIRDQAMACKKIIETYSFVDKDRIAVHGWSGGGSSTLNLLFQFPEIYQTGISVAAVANQLSYDNIYQERYMGIPQENLEDFVQGSPITHAKNLQGNLLYIHGTGDDNVHYQNAEMLLDELIKHNKQFQFMAYPNRSHGIYEGQGTRTHLSTMFTKFLKENCPPGPKDIKNVIRP